MGIGYTPITEQSGPRELVRYAALAEAAGFDLEVMSDHYFPWLTEQGHAGYARSMLGSRWVWVQARTSTSTSWAPADRRSTCGTRCWSRRSRS